jgi:hypothetical protein
MFGYLASLQVPFRPVLSPPEVRNISEQGINIFGEFI